MALSVRQRLFNRSEFTQGKSATKPHPIRPKILVRPIIEIRLDAFSMP